MNNPNNNLVLFLQELVAFRTVSGNTKAAKEILKYVESNIANYNLFVRKFSSGGFPSIVISTKKTKNPKVLLLAHTDVAPADNNDFVLKKYKGRLVGRGVFDMKFAIACYLELLQDINKRLPSLDLAIMLTSDEELGGHYGTKYLIQRGYCPKLAVVPDGGNNWQLETKAKGAWIAEITARGKSAHGSRPHEAINPINTIIPLIKQIDKIGTNYKNSTTIATTNVHAGNAVNQTPETATAIFDIRFSTIAGYKNIYAEVEKISKKHDCELNTKLFIEPSRCDIRNEYLILFASIAADIKGATIKNSISLGSSDARFFSQINVPTIVMRPNGGKQHAADEWIGEQSLYDYYELLKQFVLKSAG